MKQLCIVSFGNKIPKGIDHFNILGSRGKAIKFVEWAERVSSRLPEPDLEIRLEVEGAGRTIEVYENVQ